MTIASLARKVGVSAAAISQIESGAVQPSVATLRKLAAALEIPVFRLFLPVESEAVKVVRHTDRITIGRPWSGARYQLLSPSVQGQLEVMEVSMDPGQDSARELLSPAGEECLVVITGRGALELSDAVIDLRAGDAATFQGSIPHRLRNIGRGRLTVLSSSSRRRSDGEQRDRRPIQGQLQRQTSGSRPAVLGLTGDIAPKPVGRRLSCLTSPPSCWSTARSLMRQAGRGSFPAAARGRRGPGARQPPAQPDRRRRVHR
jgi:transcriptional regulator with XRE-family HTH domain